MAVSITLDTIVKQFAETLAIDHVSLRIEAGELFFLLGPSGCGKTTLLRTIAGFSEPTSGRVLLDREDITSLPPHKRDTGMVFQSYALWPHMTVAENVAFGLEMRKIPKEELKQRVTEALALVQMSQQANRKPNQLSGGQQQRVALARALVVHPRCLLLDEPLSNLDAKLRLEMRTEIRRICKSSGFTSVYVTHDQKEALSVADRIAVMRSGRIMQIGTPLDIYRNPTSEFVANFIGEANFLRGTVTAMDASTITVETESGAIVGRAPAAPLAVGDKATLCIRPEAIAFSPAPMGVPNRFRGILGNTIYLGEAAQHEFSIGKTVLKAFENNPRRIARDEAAAAEAWIDPEDITVFPAE